MDDNDLPKDRMDRRLKWRLYDAIHEYDVDLTEKIASHLQAGRHSHGFYSDGRHVLSRDYEYSNKYRRGTRLGITVDHPNLDMGIGSMQIRVWIEKPPTRSDYFERFDIDILDVYADSPNEVVASDLRKIERALNKAVSVLETW